MTKAIDIQNLTKIYSNQHQALKGINLSVAEGDFFALLGPNGAGKSTTIGIITSLVNKTSGSVSVFGHDLDTDMSAAKACIGLVPQEFNFSIFDTVIQIVVNQAGYYGVPRKLAYERAEHYLNQLGLWDKRNQIARNLSGGMKRRLMIARALLHQPRLLILDEPTAGVDIELRRATWEFLQQINTAGITIILTTHYLEEAEQLCKNIAIIDRGEIVENSDMKSLLQKLDVETFVFYLREPIQQLPILADYKTRLIDEMTLEVDFNSRQNLTDLFQLLNAQAIKVGSMRNKTNRLEELFLSLVKSEA